eukprot:6019867-Pleurochrysis_carterae.AAC.1
MAIHADSHSTLTMPTRMCRIHFWQSPLSPSQPHFLKHFGRVLNSESFQSCDTHASSCVPRNSSALLQTVSNCAASARTLPLA